MLRAHVLLVGVLAFMTSGADAALPALLRLAQPPPCPHCSMRGCRCGAGCCDTNRCRRPDDSQAAMDHAALSHHEGSVERSADQDGARDDDGAIRHDAAPAANRELAINPRCSGADRDALPPAGGGRPALIAHSALLVPPGGAGYRPELPEDDLLTVLHEPQTPPPRTLA